MNSKCPFCLKNQLLKTPILAESEEAYLTEAYTFPGCYLIIPKTHVESLTDLPDGWWNHFKTMFAGISDVPQHYNISLNVGAQAGQTVMHLHFWVIPRSGDGPASGKGLAGLINQSGQE